MKNQFVAAAVFIGGVTLAASATAPRPAEAPTNIQTNVAAIAGVATLTNSGAVEHMMGGARQSFRTTRVRRGAASFERTGKPFRRKNALAQTWNGGLREEIVSRSYGIEQRWRFGKKPAGRGDLEVEVAWLSDQPGHYGPATWVMADGTKVPVGSRRSGNSIVMLIPDRVLERSVYPAVLDPIVDTELALGDPIQQRAAGMPLEESVIAVGNDFWVFYEKDYPALGGSLMAFRRMSSAGAHLDIAPRRLGSVGSGPAAVVLNNEVMVAWTVGIEVVYQRFAFDGTALDAQPNTLYAPPTGKTNRLNSLTASPNTLVLEADVGDTDALDPRRPQQLIFLDRATLAVKQRLSFGHGTASLGFNGTSFIAIHQQGSYQDQGLSWSEIDESGNILVTAPLNIGSPRYGVAVTPTHAYGAWRMGSGVRLLDLGAGSPAQDFGDVGVATVGFEPAEPMPMAQHNEEAAFFADGRLVRLANGSAWADVPAAFLDAPGETRDEPQLLAINDQDTVALFQHEFVQGFQLTLGLHPKNQAATATLVSTEPTPERMTQLISNGSDVMAVWVTGRDVESAVGHKSVTAGQARVLTDKGLGFSLSETAPFTSTVVAPRASGGWFRWAITQQGESIWVLDKQDYDVTGAPVSMGPGVALVAFPSSHFEIAKTNAGYVSAFLGSPLCGGACFDALAIQRLDTDGNLLHNELDLQIQYGAANLSIARGPGGKVLMAWDRRANGYNAIEALIYDPVTGPGAPFRLLGSPAVQRKPFVYGTDNEWLVLWQDESTAGHYILASKVDANGNVGLPTQLTNETGAADAHLSDLQDGNHLALVWSGSAAFGPPDIYSLLMRKSDYTPIEGSRSLLVPGDFGAYDPHLVTTEPGRSVLAYTRRSQELGELAGAQAKIRKLTITAPNGDTCATDLDCGSDHCVDGICCAASCGTCETCAADGSACETQREVAVDDCNGDFRCSGDGECLPVEGAICTDGTGCASGFCVGGTCCNRACDGSCEQCGSGVCENLDCNGFGCQENNQGRICRETCGDTSQCEPGYQCNASSACEPIVATPPADDEGCACSAVGSPPARSWPWLIALAAGVASRRRWLGTRHRTPPPP